MEYDNQTQEAYICLREQTNFAGKHSDVKVGWMMVHEPKIMGFGHHHHVMFRPHYFAPMYSNYAFCQVRLKKLKVVNIFFFFNSRAIPRFLLLLLTF